MDKILDIVEALASQRGLDANEVKRVLKEAYINTAKKILGEDYHFDAEMDEEKRSYRLYQKIEIVADDDERLAEKNPNVISVSEAKKIDDHVEAGDGYKEEITLEKFGRTAAMTLHSELEKSLQRLTEDAVYNSYRSKVGELIFGVVTRVDSDENTYIEMGEIRAILPKKNRIKGERFKVGDTVKSIVKRVTMNMRDGIKIELSRTTPKFLEALLTSEVPEIADESITVEKAARIPGDRAKVALTSHRPHIDPVGATVGTKGVRINAVSAELNGENIDVITHSQVPEIFISRAMSPAIVDNVICKEDHKAVVVVSSDQKAKAIGRAGVNIRLASMLTGYEIELEEIGTSTKENTDETVAEEENAGSDQELLDSLFK